MADDKEKKNQKEKFDKVAKVAMISIGVAAVTCFKGLDSNVDKNFKRADKATTVEYKQTKPQTYENAPIVFKIDEQELQKMKEAEQQKKGPEKPDSIVIDEHIVEEVKIDEPDNKSLVPDSIVIDGHVVEEVGASEIDGDKTPFYNPEEIAEVKKNLKEMEVESAMEFVESYDAYKQGQKDGHSKESLDVDRESMFESGLAMELTTKMKDMMPMLEKALKIGDAMSNMVDLAEKHDEKTYDVFAKEVRQQGLSMAKDAQKDFKEAKKFTKEAKKDSAKIMKVAEAWEKNPEGKVVSSYLDDMYNNAKKILEPMRKEREKEVKQENKLEAAELKQGNNAYKKEVRNDGSEARQEARKYSRETEAEMRKEHKKTSNVSVQDMINNQNGR